MPAQPDRYTPGSHRWPRERLAVGLAGVVLAAALLISAPNGGAVAATPAGPRSVPTPTAPPTAPAPTAPAPTAPAPTAPTAAAMGIVIDQVGPVASATVAQIMPGVPGELELVGLSGEVVDRTPLGPEPARLDVAEDGAYRLRFTQQAASSGDGVSISGLAMVGSAPFSLSAGDVVLAELAP